MKNDNASRNYTKDLQAKTINKILVGNQRSGTNRDSRGYSESSDFGQNFTLYEVNEESTIGFSIVGP